MVLLWVTLWRVSRDRKAWRSRGFPSRHSRREPGERLRIPDPGRLLCRRRRRQARHRRLQSRASNFLPTVRMCMAASPLSTTSRGIARPRWRNGSRLSRCSPRSLTAPAFPKVSGLTLAAPAINWPREIVRRAQARCRCHPPHLCSPQRQLSFECSAALGVCGRGGSRRSDGVAARSFFGGPRSDDYSCRCRRRFLDSACAPRADLPAHSRIEGRCR